MALHLPPPCYTDPVGTSDTIGIIFMTMNFLSLIGVFQSGPKGLGEWSNTHSLQLNVTHHLFKCERRLGCCSLSNCDESDLLEHFPEAGVQDAHEHLINPLIVGVFDSHGHKSCLACVKLTKILINVRCIYKFQAHDMRSKGELYIDIYFAMEGMETLPHFTGRVVALCQEIGDDQQRETSANDEIGLDIIYHKGAHCLLLLHTALGCDDGFAQPIFQEIEAVCPLTYICPQVFPQQGVSHSFTHSG